MVCQCLLILQELVRNAVHKRFLDQSIAVRDAAVELIGKYILERPEFIPQYFSMIMDRSLDRGISVRKRVIKILGDICLADPAGQFTSQICIKLASRINDEESIRETVLKVFQELWFGEKDRVSVQARTDLIMEVVGACGLGNHEWLVDLLERVRRIQVSSNKVSFL